MQEGTAAAFSARQFRDALGHFATGVAVVSCEHEGDLLGSTVSSFNSVSLDPPLVLFSLANSAASLPAWLAVRHYAVSLLTLAQAEMSNRFAKAMGDKWKNVCPDRGQATGAPLVPGAHAWFECESFAHHPAGDHTIFVGRVLSMRVHGAADQQPLVFYKGGYRRLAREVESMPPDEGLWLHAW